MLICAAVLTVPVLAQVNWSERMRATRNLDGVPPGESVQVSSVGDPFLRTLQGTPRWQSMAKAGQAPSLTAESAPYRLEITDSAATLMRLRDRKALATCDPREEACVLRIANLWEWEAHR